MDKNKIKILKRKTPKLGDFLEIPLPEGFRSYARVLENPLVAFYNIKTKESLSPAEIIKIPVLFKIFVMNSAVRSGRWAVIGHAPLEAEHEISPWFFKEDPISGELTVYRDRDMMERPASREECLELECAAVWELESVENRLDDQLAGRPNEEVESLRSCLVKPL